MNTSNPLHFCLAYKLGFLNAPRQEALLRGLQNLSLPRLQTSLCIQEQTGEFKLPHPIYQKIDTYLKVWTQEKGYDVLCPFDTDYPKSLLQISSPPLILFVQGEKVWKKNYLLGVVGKRDLSSHTQKWIQSEFYKFLQTQTNICILSGGARGVDQLAHKASLAFNHPTCVVLPSGFDQVYPKTLLSLQQEILQNKGCLLTTYLPQTPMYKSHFHARNEVLAGLCDSALILEAEMRSGTYKTAKYCQNLDRPLSALPSSPQNASYSGSLQVLYDGAQMIRDAKDLACFCSLNSKNLAT